MLLGPDVHGAKRPAAIDDRDVIALELRLAQVLGQDAEEVDQGIGAASQSGVPPHGRVTVDRSQC